MTWFGGVKISSVLLKALVILVGDVCLLCTPINSVYTQNRVLGKTWLRRSSFDKNWQWHGLAVSNSAVSF